MYPSLFLVLLALAARAAPVKRQQVISPEQVAAADKGTDGAAVPAAVQSSLDAPASTVDESATPVAAGGTISTESAATDAGPTAPPEMPAPGSTSAAPEGSGSADVTVVKVCSAPRISLSESLTLVRLSRRVS